MDPQALNQLRDAIVNAYADSLAPVFWYLLPFIALALLLAITLKQIPLSDTAGMVVRDEAVGGEEAERLAAGLPGTTAAGAVGTAAGGDRVTDDDGELVSQAGDRRRTVRLAAVGREPAPAAHRRQAGDQQGRRNLEGARRPCFCWQAGQRSGVTLIHRKSGGDANLPLPPMVRVPFDVHTNLTSQTSHQGGCVLSAEFRPALSYL